MGEADGLASDMSRSPPSWTMDESMWVGSSSVLGAAELPSLVEKM